MNSPSINPDPLTQGREYAARRASRAYRVRSARASAALERGLTLEQREQRRIANYEKRRAQIQADIDRHRASAQPARSFLIS